VTNGTVYEGRARWTYLADFGEFGKNFIEIGKVPRLQETMLRIAVE
jgi:hypothetical protein